MAEIKGEIAVSSMYPTTDLWQAVVKNEHSENLRQDIGPEWTQIDALVMAADATMDNVCGMTDEMSDARRAPYVNAASALLVAEAILHAADRIVRAIDRAAQVRAASADKPDGAG